MAILDIAAGMATALKHLFVTNALKKLTSAFSRMRKATRTADVSVRRYYES